MVYCTRVDGKTPDTECSESSGFLGGEALLFFVNKFTTYNVDLSRHFLAIHESNFRIWWNDTPETAFHLEAHLRTKWNDKWNEWNDAKNRRSTNYDIII